MRRRHFGGSWRGCGAGQDGRGGTRQHHGCHHQNQQDACKLSACPAAFGYLFVFLCLVGAKQNAFHGFPPVQTVLQWFYNFTSFLKTVTCFFLHLLIRPACTVIIYKIPNRKGFLRFNFNNVPVFRKSGAMLTMTE
jgi:hypothetical protein